MKLPLEGLDRLLWSIGVGVAVLAVGILVWTKVTERPGEQAEMKVPVCSDPGYLRDVQDIVRFNGLKEVRSDGEHSSGAMQRHCRLLARDASGKDVRLRGSIIRVGADIQLSVQPEQLPVYISK